MKIHEEMKDKALEFMHRKIDDMAKRITKLVDRQNNLLDLLRLKKSQESYISAVHDYKAYLSIGLIDKTQNIQSKRSALPTSESSRKVSKLRLRDNSELSRSMESSYGKGYSIIGKGTGRNSCLNSRRTSLCKQGDLSKNSSTGTYLPITKERPNDSITEIRPNGKKLSKGTQNPNALKKRPMLKSLQSNAPSKKLVTRNANNKLSSSMSHRMTNI